MIRVRWTTRAADDLTHIVERIRKDNPQAAGRVARTIFDSIALLRMLPQRGRPGRIENTRELTFAPWPYVAVYEFIESRDEVQVLRIRHTSQNWP